MPKSESPALGHVAHVPYSSAISGAGWMTKGSKLGGDQDRFLNAPAVPKTTGECARWICDGRQPHYIGSYLQWGTVV